jgi:type I restriction enzyme S subunit
MTGSMNVPQLRFSEFSGEWVEKQFDSLVKLISEKYNSEKNKSVQKCIELEHIDQLTGRLLGYVASDEFGSIKNRFKKNNILFGKLRPYLRKYIKAPFDGVCSSEIWVFDGKLVINEYLYYLVQTESFIELADQSTGSKMPRADWSYVSVSFFKTPSLPEQTKIASFLSAVDTKIDQLTQKKALLETYKKGAMQKIFSQQLRFKADDEDYPEWEKKKLGEIVNNVGGTALEKFVSNDGQFKFVSIGNYTTSGKYIDNGQRVVLNNKTKDKILNKYDLVMVLNDKTAKGDIIGSTILIDADNSYIYNQRSERLICKNVIHPLYLWFYLNSAEFRKTVFGIAQGGTQIYVNFSAVKELFIDLASFPEQTKIAAFFSAIDRKIDLVSQQLEQAKAFKKGLLQQMFV